MVDTSNLAAEIAAFLKQPGSVTPLQAERLLEQALEAIEQLGARLLVERARANLVLAEVDRIRANLTDAEMDDLK